MTDKNYVLGIDFGSDSARCILADADDGQCLSESSENYTRWSRKLYCSPGDNMYRQHPLDHVESLISAVRKCLEQVPQDIRDRVRGISSDTTASTPVLTDRTGTPLSLLPGLEDNPDAMFVLWKDHTAVREADEINSLAKRQSTDYTMYSGGSYSCEWVWAKMLHCLRNSPELRDRTWSWTEHCDWICAMLTGNTAPEKMFRSRCAAGHKAMWNEAWGGLPPTDFFTNVDPLYRLFDGHLYKRTYPNGTRAGFLCDQWLKRFGLKGPVAVGLGAIDCHIGAIGAGIRPGTWVKVVGTSTCDIAIAHGTGTGEAIPGICGQVRDSVLPGYIGYEAGQAAFGDLYAWFSRLVSWGREENPGTMIDMLTMEAQKIARKDDSPIFVDWLNGRRSPFASMSSKGAVTGLTLSTSAPELFSSIVESSCFGSRAITEHLIRNGVKVERIVATGGIAVKSPFVMQTMADVLQMPVEVPDTQQTCALGAAICAAAAAGIYPDIFEARDRMSAKTAKIFRPDPALRKYYDRRYAAYLKTGHDIC